jgi:S-formylglutathione hydrolase FrmB
MLVICLHGRGNDYSFAFDAIHLHDVVASAHAPLAVVGVDGGPDSYWHKRRRGVDPQSMLQDELLPLLDRALGAGLKRALLGWSMGGYGALLTAEHHPDEYRSVVASSPALWLTPGATAPGAFDDAADYALHDVFAGVDSLKSVDARIDCGTDDPFISSARAFAAKLPAPNHGSFSRGFHDAAFWRSVAPAQIAFIAAAT